VNKNLRISVRSLVEHMLKTGDLSSPFDGLTRPNGLTGIRAHQKIQQSRPASYTPEVPVEYLVNSDPYNLQIQGRIDGVYRHLGVQVLEEIKTTQRDLDSFISGSQVLHWAQLRVYAACYAAVHESDELTLQLTYLQVNSGQVQTFFQNETAETLALFLEGLVDRYLDWVKQIDRRKARRDRSIHTVDFPYPVLRAGQSRMMDEVRAAFQSREQCLIQAPTGTGKTVAALCPALRALAEQDIERVFYLTARTTGRAIAEKTLDEMREKGLKVKSLTLTAKEKICAMPDGDCSAETCRYARGYYDRLPKARDELFMHEAFTRDLITELAEKHQLCPFELSLDLALWMDVIICDFNYAFDPRVYLKRFFLEHLADSGFLVDEAHNLVDRAREMFSAELRKSRFLEIRRLIKNTQPELHRLAGRINSRLLEKKRALAPELHSWESERPEKLLSLLRQYGSALERAYVSQNNPSVRRVLLEHYFETLWFQRVGEFFDDSYAQILESQERELRIRLFCTDPSTRLRAAFQRARASVLFSATLSPMSYFSEILGLEKDSRTCRLPSPFPAENLCVMTLGTVSTYFRHRRMTRSKLVNAIGVLTGSRAGNYLVFFPSYAYLDMVRPLYLRAFPEHEVLVQRQGMSEPEREVFLSRFSRESGGTLVGLAVLGGIFGEGIDLMGDRLAGAVIVGVGLPGISLERELIRHFFEEESQEGFNFGYVFPGMIRVLQAAGRVIRSEHDRGVILLVDPRYRRPQYQDLLPEEWDVRSFEDPIEIRRTLGLFWGSGAEVSSWGLP
jgi:DNA excision repair protein ERCC-2